MEWCSWCCAGLMNKRSAPPKWKGTWLCLRLAPNKVKRKPSALTPKISQTCRPCPNSHTKIPDIKPRDSTALLELIKLSTGWVRWTVIGVSVVAEWCTLWKRQSTEERCMQTCTKKRIQSSNKKAVSVKAIDIAIGDQEKMWLSVTLKCRNFVTVSETTTWPPNTGANKTTLRKKWNKFKNCPLVRDHPYIT